jgi:hypothetical protein
LRVSIAEISLQKRVDNPVQIKVARLYAADTVDVVHRILKASEGPGSRFREGSCFEAKLFSSFSFFPGLYLLFIYLFYLLPEELRGVGGNNSWRFGSEVTKVKTGPLIRRSNRYLPEPVNRVRTLPFGPAESVPVIASDLP